MTLFLDVQKMRVGLLFEWAATTSATLLSRYFSNMKPLTPPLAVLLEPAPYVPPLLV
jgi:hypothetical protein